MCERLEFIYNSLLSDSPPPGASGGGPARASCILLNYKSARPGLNIYGQRPLICEMKFCGESRVGMGRMQRSLSQQKRRSCSDTGIGARDSETLLQKISRAESNRSITRSCARRLQSLVILNGGGVGE
jgi:hypothetical protein